MILRQKKFPFSKKTLAPSLGRIWEIKSFINTTNQKQRNGQLVFLIRTEKIGRTLLASIFAVSKSLPCQILPIFLFGRLPRRFYQPLLESRLSVEEIKGKLFTIASAPIFSGPQMVQPL